MGKPTQTKQIIRMISAHIPPFSDEAAKRIHKNLFPHTLRFRVQRRTLLALAACLLLFCGWFFFVNRNPAQCTCWHFVGFDAGNTRHVPMTEQPGQLIWRQPLHAFGGFAKPLAWKNLVLVSASGSKSAPSFIEAYEAATGQLVWKTGFEEGAINRDKSVSDRFIQNSRLFIVNGASCLSLDAFTGRDLRRIDPPPGVSGWSFLSSDKKGLIGASSDGRTLFKMDPETGKNVWTTALAGDAGAPAIQGARLFCLTDKGELAALDTRNGSVIWTKRLEAGQGRSRIHANGRWGIAVTEKDEAAVFDLETGAMAWERGIPGIYTSGLALGSDTLYLDGGKSALDLATGTEVVRGAADSLGRCSPPVLAGDRIIETFSLVSALPACEGVIMAGRRFFTVSNGFLLAFTAVELKS